jgi:nucleotide-binding universal stress UspA family protein
VIATMRQQLGTELEGLADTVRGQGITVHTELVDGIAYKGIADYAAEWKADLIVMGTHGRTGLAHMLTGSVAERVVRTAHCPVLITRGHD